MDKLECAFCNYTNSNSALYCLNCGNSISFLCTTCSHRLPINIKFCTKCGYQSTEAQESKEHWEYQISSSEANQQLIETLRYAEHKSKSEHIRDYSVGKYKITRYCGCMGVLLYILSPLIIIALLVVAVRALI